MAQMVDAGYVAGSRSREAVTSFREEGSMARARARARALALGRGGVAAVARAAEMSRSTVQTAANEVDEGIVASVRVRRPGGGRRKAIDKDPNLLLELDDLVSPDTRGDPMSPLRWTLKSTRVLAEALQAKGFKISASLVGQLLHKMGYSLQATAKVTEGAQHPDRNGQFEYLNARVKEFLAAGQPVISVDTKKKELVGAYAQRRPGVAAGGGAEQGRRARLPRSGDAQGRPLRRL